MESGSAAREDTIPEQDNSDRPPADPRGSAGEVSTANGEYPQKGPADNHSSSSRNGSGKPLGRSKAKPSPRAAAGFVPPHDIEVEQAVLGSMLVKGKAVSEASEVLTSGDFYSEAHRSIYEVMEVLISRGDPVDQLTVASELQTRAEYERVGGRDYILELVESIPRAANARRYADIVRGKAMLRSLGDAGTRIQQLSYSEPEEPAAAVDEAERILYETVRRGAGGEDLRALHDVAPGTLETIQQKYEEAEEEQPTGERPLSGLPDVDSLVGGHKTGDLVTLAARPAMGKTAYAIGAALATASLGIPVAIFSLEMSSEQIVQRMISQITSIPTTALDSGKVSAEQWPELVRAVASLGKLPIWIDESEALTPTVVQAKSRRLDARLRSAAGGATDGGTAQGGVEGLGLVVADHIQLLDGGGRFDSRQQEISAISRGLKRIARSIDCTMLALSQLSRAVEQRNDKRPLLSDLRDSGSLEQDSDMVIFLYRDEYYNPEDSEDKGTAEVIVGKYRNGPTGKVRVSWLGSRARFAGLSRGVDTGA